MGSDASLDPDWQRNGFAQALKQDESGLLPDPAPGFVPLGDDTVGAGSFRRPGGFLVHGLDQHAHFEFAQAGEVTGQLPGCGSGEDDPSQVRRRVFQDIRC